MLADRIAAASLEVLREMEVSATTGAIEAPRWQWTLLARR